jgi:hypothetical protein
MRKLMLLAAILLFSRMTLAQSNVTQAEYFVDADPGIGNGTSISLSVGQSPTASFNVPTTSLSVGVHTVYVRGKNANGTWGIPEGRSFYVSSTATTTVANVNNAEYFVDADPGIGSGTAITITPGQSPTASLSIATNALSVGFHTVYVRGKNANGTWGIPEGRSFYVSSTATTTVANVNNAEYFVDADPGIGSGTAITITPGQSPTASLSIATNALSVGFHTVYVRGKNANGTWGIPEGRSFYINGATGATVAKIVKLEYFVDADPGVGLATSVQITPPSLDTTFTTNLNVNSGSLSVGTHYLFVRGLNANGVWGIVERDTLIVTAAVLPVELVSFDGKMNNGAVLLTWQTATEKNNAGFEIQRATSVAANDWKAIATVKGAGTTTAAHTYSYLDKSNFIGKTISYRLKQTDYDGKSVVTNSIDVKIDLPKTFSLNQNYPNPFNPMTTINYGLPRSSHVTLQVFDILGRLVQTLVNDNQDAGFYNVQLNASALASGMYFYRMTADNFIQSKKMLLIK